MRQVLGRRGVWDLGWSKKPINQFKPFKQFKRFYRLERLERLNQFDLFEPFDRFNRLDLLFLNVEDEWVIILKI